MGWSYSWKHKILTMSTNNLSKAAQAMVVVTGAGINIDGWIRHSRRSMVIEDVSFYFIR